MRSFSRFSAASLLRRRCTRKTANPAHNRTTTASTYHGQTSRDGVFLTTMTAIDLDDCATEDAEAAEVSGSGTTNAELAGTLVTGVVDAAGVVVDDDATTGAVTSNVATPVTFEVWPTALSRCVPGGRFTGTVNWMLTMPSASAVVLGSLMGSEYSVTATGSFLANPANRTCCFPPAATEGEPMVLGCTVVPTTAAVLVMTSCDVVVGEELVGVLDDVVVAVVVGVT